MSFWENYTKYELEHTTIKNLCFPLGLTRDAWEFSRGAKTERHYKKNDITYIKVSYDYTYKDNDETFQVIEHCSKKIDFLESDGSIFHTIPVPCSLNSKSLKSLNRSIRVGRLDYMYHAGEQLTVLGNSLPSSVTQQTLNQLIADGLVHPSYNTPLLYLTYRLNLIALVGDIEELYAHYITEIYNYKDRGLTDFWDAVHSETDSSILNILNVDLPPDDVFINGFTIKDAIRYQLRGILP